MSCTVVIKDKNLKPENIKKDITILKVKGTFEGGSEPVLQSKTVDVSTYEQVVTPDQGYDGLSSVTVNEVQGTYEIDQYTYNQSGFYRSVYDKALVHYYDPKVAAKTVDPSTSQQTFNPLNEQVQFYNGITINAVDASIDSNIQPGNIKKDVTILGVTGTYESSPVQPVLQDVSLSYNQNGSYTVNASSGYDGLGTVDVSVNVPSSGGNDWVLEAKAGNISDLSSHEMYAPSRSYQYYNFFKSCEIDKLPDMSGWTSISGTSSCEDMFRDASSNNSGDRIADLSSLTTLSSSNSVKNMFNGSKITELRLQNLSSIGSSSGLENIIGQTEASTLKTLKINVAVAQPYGMTGALTGSSNLAGVENIEMTGMATSNVNFNYMTNLTADSVLSILTHLGTPIIGNKKVIFASNGLTVTDYPDGRIQAAYDAAIATGYWNIYYLTITPYSA